MEQPEAVGFGGAEALGGQEIAPRSAHADRLDHVGADRRRDQAEPCLGKRKHRVLRSDRDIAAGNQAHAASEDCPVYAGDRRFGQRVECGEHRRQRVRIGEILRPAESSHLFHPVEIGARAEALARPGQHDRPHGGIAVERAQHRRELGDQRFIERVMYRRPVEHDDRDCVAYADVERFIGSARRIHRCSLLGLRGSTLARAARLGHALPTSGTRRTACARWGG